MKKSNNIPKTIHYCWFGGSELPKEALKCIESWKKIMPTYKIIRWDETNYDVSKCKFMKQAYENKKWAFVSDYARLDIVYQYGGIYFDTDVEVLKSFDDLLKNDAFMGFESVDYVSTGIGFGAKPKNKIIKDNLKEYKYLEFVNNDGTLNQITCPIITTKVLSKRGAKMNNSLQNIEGITLYPTEYFCPKDYYLDEINITNNTYSIHNFSMTWLSERDKKWHKFEKILSKKIGKKISRIFVSFLKLPGSFIEKSKKFGLIVSIKYYFKKISELI